MWTTPRTRIVFILIADITVSLSETIKECLADFFLAESYSWFLEILAFLSENFRNSSWITVKLIANELGQQFATEAGLI